MVQNTRRFALLALFSIGALIVPSAVRAIDWCTCATSDSGQVTVDDLIKGVNLALDDSCSEPEPLPSTLLQTGQTQCDNGSGTLGTCPGTPAGQDGDFHAGRPLQYTDNGDGTITDNTTHLMWEKLSDDGSIHDVDNTYTWQESFTGKVAALNTAQFAGQTDWRVPNRRELDSLLLLDPNQGHPAIAPAFDKCSPGCTATAPTCSCTRPKETTGLYWSSTSYAADPTFGWIVNFNSGEVNSYVKSGEIPCSEIECPGLRAVRGGL